MHTIHFLVRGDIVNMMKDMAFMAAGAVLMTVYQKYKEPVCEAVTKVINEEKNMVKKTIENVM